MLAQVPGNSATCSTTNSRADLLNCRHERIREQHGPTDVESKLRTGLAVGCDPRWIIIGSPGHQPWPENGEEATQQGSLSFFIGHFYSLTATTQKKRHRSPPGFAPPQRIV